MYRLKRPNGLNTVKAITNNINAQYYEQSEVIQLLYIIVIK